MEDNKPSRSWGRRLVRGLALLILCLVVVAGGAALWLRSQLHGSLAQLEGQATLAGLQSTVQVERDAAGVPTLTGENRVDLSRALGFLHGQERFFQMDLLRRSAAGELAELVGAAAFRADRRVRVHRFRHRAEALLETMSAEHREHFEAYTEGVNAGLSALGAKPFEYLVLRTEPQPWRHADSVLAVFAMYLDLQGGIASRDSSYGVLHDIQPELFEFLAPRGSEWDAPIDGTEAFATPSIPSPEEIDLVAQAARLEPAAIDTAPPLNALHPFTLADLGRNADVGLDGNMPDDTVFDDNVPGSNNWAVAGSHSKHGGALIADDMHLGLRTPNIWYRASLVYPAEGGERRITGVTLPGAMVVIAGSNGRVAWGFTNSAGDWGDLVELEPAGEGKYQTPDGPREFTVHQEVLRAKDGSEEVLEVRETIWGPVLDQDHQGRDRAYHWVAYTPRAVNLGLLSMEDADTLEDAVEVAAISGTPAQNLMMASAAGRIGWTILGPIPRRKGDYDSRLPSSWTDGTRGWDGWLSAEEAPRVLDPEVGRLWTANSRVVGGEMYAAIGDGGYDLGARTTQIRDDLLALDQADEADMLDVQLDDRALFLEPWHRFFLAALEAAEAQGAPATPVEASDADLVLERRASALRLLRETWTGRAEPSSVAYRLVRAMRLELRYQVYEALTGPSRAADERFRTGHLRFAEGPLWKLLEERPAHLLDPRFDTWDEQVLAAVDTSLEGMANLGGSLDDRTWGERNRVSVAHPLSQFLPEGLRSYLDMPTVELAGDSNMPRVQAPTFGASERFAVSPGKEELGYFHMPSGQSGHPLSPFYRQGHEAWVQGDATPFLPGEAAYTLELIP